MRERRRLNSEALWAEIARRASLLSPALQGRAECRWRECHIVKVVRKVYFEVVFLSMTYVSRGAKNTSICRSSVIE